jgi:hypothetical protein
LSIIDDIISSYRYSLTYSTVTAEQKGLASIYAS